MKALHGKRIQVCGKGGCGKSSFISLMANYLESQQYEVILLDGDASNPGGLKCLISGSKIAPRPLIDFFGGREKITCPIYDPSPICRLDSQSPLTEMHIKPNEIPHEYYIQENGIRLFQVGKIQKLNEGCDGPMSKITRDFIIEGPYVTLIDMEAGIEHFGRGIDQHVDVLLVVVDPTYESLEIAQRVKELSGLLGIEHVLAVVNAVRNSKTEIRLRKKLVETGVDYLGTLEYEEEIFEAGLEGTAIHIEDVPEQFDLLENMGQKLEGLFAMQASN